MSRSHAEQETILRFDRNSPIATFWTAHPAMAARWKKQGYPVQVDGAGWRCEVPATVVMFRRLGQKPPAAAETGDTVGLPQDEIRRGGLTPAGGRRCFGLAFLLRATGLSGFFGSHAADVPLTEPGTTISTPADSR